MEKASAEVFQVAVSNKSLLAKAESQQISRL